MNYELINGIYNQTINTIMKNVSAEYILELSNGYKDYLIKNYSKYETSGKNIDSLIKVFVELELSKWSNSSAEIKFSEFLKDEALENIRTISNNGYKYAEARLNKSVISNGEILPVPPILDEETAENNIMMLENLLPKVRNFNISLANFFVSEGILDYKYASGQTEITSLRIGRIK